MKVRQLCVLLFLVIWMSITTCEADELRLRVGIELPQGISLSNTVLQEDSLFVYEGNRQRLYQIHLDDASVQEYQVWEDSKDSSTWHEAVLCRGDALRALEVEYQDVNGRYAYSRAWMTEWGLNGSKLIRTNEIPLDLSEFIEDNGFQDVLPSTFEIIWKGESGFLFLKREDRGEFYSVSDIGKIVDLPIGNASKIIEADAGKVLFAREQDGDTLIQVYNTVDKRFSTLTELPFSISNAWYNENEEALYYVTDAIYRLTSKEPEKSEMVAGKPFSQCVAAFNWRKKLVFCEPGQIAIISDDGSRELRKLVIAGTIGDILYSDYSAENSSIVLSQIGSLSEKEILTRMLTRDGSVDIYIFMPSANRGYQTLRNRGFCQPLTEAAAQQFVRELYPDIRDDFFDESGEVCALPVEISSNIKLGVDMKLWDNLKFGALPQTWEQLFDFIETKWAAFSHDNADVRLLPYDTAEETKSALFYALKADYGYYRAQEKTPIEYSTPIYRKLLAQLLRIDFDAFQYSGGTTPALLNDWYEATPERIHMDAQSSVKYLPLSVDGVIYSKIVFRPGIAFINPYSEHQGEAQAFMGFLAEHMSGELRIALQPKYSIPVKSKHYDRIVQFYEETSEALNAQLESATEVEKTELLREIEENEAFFKENLNTGAYAVGPDAISAYKDLIASAGIAFIYDSSETSDTLDQIADIGMQVMNGQIDIDTYTAELDRIQTASEKEDM